MRIPDPETNLKHLKQPQPGDYWHETFAPVCVILSVDPADGVVRLCRTTKQTDKDHWTWDLDDPENIETMSLPAFETWLSYERKPEEGIKCWCDVAPGSHQWAVDYMQGKMGITKYEYTNNESTKDEEEEIQIQPPRLNLAPIEALLKDEGAILNSLVAYADDTGRMQALQDFFKLRELVKDLEELNTPLDIVVNEEPER